MKRPRPKQPRFARRGRDAHSSPAPESRATQRFLDVVEWVGNKLPDPAFLFVFALFITWGVSALLAPLPFEELDPRTRQPVPSVCQMAGQGGIQSA